MSWKPYSEQEREQFIKTVTTMVANRCREDNINHPEDIAIQFDFISEILAEARRLERS